MHNISSNIQRCCVYLIAAQQQSLVDDFVFMTTVLKLSINQPINIHFLSSGLIRGVNRHQNSENAEFE